VWLRLELGSKHSEDSPKRESFLLGVINDLCPYLRALLVDSIISGSLWLALFAFNWLTHFLPIEGMEGETARVFHAAVTILAFPTFGIKFIIDVFIISKGQNHHS
jgi:hypothetical protein